MGIFAFFGLIYIAYKILTEEWGMGDFHRDSAKMYEQMGKPDFAKYERKKASDSDGAVALCIMFLAFVGIIVLLALCGVGS